MISVMKSIKIIIWNLIYFAINIKISIHLIILAISSKYFSDLTFPLSFLRWKTCAHCRRNSFHLVSLLACRVTSCYIFTARDHIEHQPTSCEKWLKQKLISFTWGLGNKLIFDFSYINHLSCITNTIIVLKKNFKLLIFTLTVFWKDLNCQNLWLCFEKPFRLFNCSIRKNISLKRNSS
jgi:hypothetical protein